ncbi:MAG: hypothetical protein HC906_05895 [Bacteroidales bacterium]|nr:hypothetical protein [Bacteroidales bacterium]
MGKISNEEFNIKGIHNDTTAPAVILCDLVTISITNRTFYTRHIRIKINSEKGVEYAK